MMFLLPGCFNPDTVTRIVDLETDTHISTVTGQNNSMAPALSIENSGSLEARALVKFPTGTRNFESNLDSCTNNVFCAIFFIPLVIVQALISSDCSDESFTAANLNWAYLQFDAVDPAGVSAGALQPELLGQSWWHSVTWERAHPFSNAGKWLQPGGTVNSSRSFEPNCTNLQGGQTCTAGEVKFEMTEYLRDLLNNPNSTHYGFLIRSPNSAGEVQLHSVQTQTGSKPSVVANYNCISTNASEDSVFFLGQD